MNMEWWKINYGTGKGGKLKPDSYSEVSVAL